MKCVVIFIFGVIVGLMIRTVLLWLNSAKGQFKREIIMNRYNKPITKIVFSVNDTEKICSKKLILLKLNQDLPDPPKMDTHE